MSTSRCVHCSLPEKTKLGHATHPNSHCEKFESMDLPEGKVCADCHNYMAFCREVIGKHHEECTCDYFPIRFVQIAEVTHA